jgi:hypothetical protein
MAIGLSYTVGVVGYCIFPSFYCTVFHSLLLPVTVIPPPQLCGCCLSIPFVVTVIYGKTVHCCLEQQQLIFMGVLIAEILEEKFLIKLLRKKLYSADLRGEYS